MRRHAAAALLLAFLAASATAPVSAQEPTAAATAQPSDPALELPAQLGGVTAEVFVTRGEEHVANLDLEDPAQAEIAVELQRVFDATGTTVEDMTSGYSFASAEESEFFAFVVAVRLEGATPGTLLPAYLPVMRSDLVDPSTESGTIAGRDVLLISSESSDEIVKLVVYETGDTVWMIQGPADVVAEVLESLP